MALGDPTHQQLQLRTSEAGMRPNPGAYTICAAIAACDSGAELLCSSCRSREKPRKVPLHSKQRVGGPRQANLRDSKQTSLARQAGDLYRLHVHSRTPLLFPTTLVMWTEPGVRSKGRGGGGQRCCRVCGHRVATCMPQAWLSSRCHHAVSMGAPTHGPAAAAASDPGSWLPSHHPTLLT